MALGEEVQKNIYLLLGFQYFENMERAPIKVPVGQDILFEEACKKHFASDWSGIGDDFDDDDFEGFWRQEPSTRLYWYVGVLKLFCSGVEYTWSTFGWSIGCYLRYYAIQDAERCEPDTVKWLAVLLNGLHFVSLEKPTFGMICLLEKLFLPSDDWITSCGGEFDPDAIEFIPDPLLRQFIDSDRLRSLVARK